LTSRTYMSSPDVTQAEEDALVRALRSGWVAPLGPEVDAFEAELAEVTGRSFAVALSSGTAALHLGLLHLGVGPGDVVITSTMTFAATANAITYTGATPVFVDSDETGNVDPVLVEKAIQDQLRAGERVAAVVPVDLLGKVADHPSINAVASRHGIPVLVDAAESLGARRHGRPAGAEGAAAVVSFNGNKIITTSGGGALLCDDPDMSHRVRYLATQARQPVAHYEHVDIGFNYRLSNLLAAVGRAQLDRLPEMLERRRRWRRRYRELVAPMDGITIFGGPDGVDAAVGEDHDNFWLTSILVEETMTGWSVEDLRLHLGQADIEARPLWKPMHLQPVFADRPAYTNGTSERLFRTGLSLPSGSVLTDDQFERVLEHIQSFVAARS
jgi:dTDP-4-amino-4,6-dideoxygalactose transaminase